MTAIDQNWDIENYRAEHESDEHWDLRRKFMIKYKNRFSEDELVCLARVFTNIELLGCRYPLQTMKLVAELSKDIAMEYRKKRENKIKRTFIGASEAAAKKAKRFSV